jgi:hypothetical protein
VGRTWAENGVFERFHLRNDRTPVRILTHQGDPLGLNIKTLVGFPGFPVELVGVGGLHAAFLNESRTRGSVWRHVQEIRVAHLLRPRYALANLGHPSYSFRLCYDTDSVGTQFGEGSSHADSKARTFKKQNFVQPVEPRSAYQIAARRTLSSEILVPIDRPRIHRDIPAAYSTWKGTSPRVM